MPATDNSRLTRRTWKVLWLAYVTWILYMALGPAAVDTGVDHGDKILHVGAFGFMFLCYPFEISSGRLWLATALAVSLAGFIEIGQDLSPAYGRTPEILDFFASLAGGLAGIGIRLLLPPLSHPEESRHD